MIRVRALYDLSPGEATRDLPHVPVAVLNADGEVFAIDDTCTQQDASLSEGWLEGCQIECALHAASFDLRTGERTGFPAERPVLTSATQIKDGVVYVDTRAHGAESAKEAVGALHQPPDDQLDLLLGVDLPSRIYPAHIKNGAAYLHAADAGAGGRLPLVRQLNFGRAPATSTVSVSGGPL